MKRCQCFMATLKLLSVTAVASVWDPGGKRGGEQTGEWRKPGSWSKQQQHRRQLCPSYGKTHLNFRRFVNSILKTKKGSEGDGYLVNMHNMKAASAPAALSGKSGSAQRNTLKWSCVFWDAGLRRWWSSAELWEAQRQIYHREPFVFLICRFILKSVAAPLRLTDIQGLNGIASVLFTNWKKTNQNITWGITVKKDVGNLTVSGLRQTSERP